MQIRLSNRIGLLALLCAVAGMVLVGITYPISPYLATLAGIVAIVSVAVFVVYLYKFFFYSPALELPEEETDEEAR